MTFTSRLSRVLSTGLLQPFKDSGISHYLPRGPSLSPAARQRWLAQAQAPAVYTGAPRLPFPLLPFQVFAVHYDMDIVVETDHPHWRMHEFARLASGDRNVWMVKDADGHGIQTVNADLPDITQWFPEIPVPRHTSTVDVQELSTSELLKLRLTYTNPHGEVTTLWFQSPLPLRKATKRNGSTFNHSQAAVAAILDIPARQTQQVKAQLFYDGKPARLRKILRLVPVKALLEQTQAGFAVASMQLRQASEQSLVIARPLPQSPWPTSACETWASSPHGLHHHNRTSTWHYRFDQREMTRVTVHQVGMPQALLHIHLSAPLPDLSRPFAGGVKRHFVMEVNGQTHGHGWLQATSHGDTTIIDIRPTAPKWFAARPMRTRLHVVNATTVDMTTHRVEASDLQV